MSFAKEDSLLVRDNPSADTHVPARGMSRRWGERLSLFRIAWTVACLLTTLALVIQAFVRPPTVEWWVALVGAVAALPGGLLFLRYVRHQLESSVRATAVAVAPAGDALSEPTCFQEPDRFWFAGRVQFPRKVASEPSRLIFEECGPVRLAFVILLEVIGIGLLVCVPIVWSHGAAVGPLVFQLVLGVGLTVGCSPVFLRLRIELDREIRRATFRWGLGIPLRTEVKCLAAFDSASVCCTAGPPTKGGRRREYVVRLCSSKNREDFLAVLQVLSREHAERLARELTEFLGARS